MSELHLNYETVEPYPVTETIVPDATMRVEKMRYLKRGRDTDKTTIIYNSEITVSDIPVEAQEYMLGSRSALDWIIERYQVKTEKASGIVNDPKRLGRRARQPPLHPRPNRADSDSQRETVKIVNALPPLDIIE